MDKHKTGLIDAKKQHDFIILKDIPQHQGLVKVNRFLLLAVSLLMLIVFTLGFFLLPANHMLDNFKAQQKLNSAAYPLQIPTLSAEINTLKSQLIGIVSGSIESKLRILEASIRTGSTEVSLGTIQDLRNEVKVLQTYSVPIKKETQGLSNEALINEVSQLKTLIYLTLTSCGLMITAIGGIWYRNQQQPNSKQRVELKKYQ